MGFQIIFFRSKLCQLAEKMRIHAWIWSRTKRFSAALFSYLKTAKTELCAFCLYKNENEKCSTGIAIYSIILDHFSLSFSLFAQLFSVNLFWLKISERRDLLRKTLFLWFFFQKTIFISASKMKLYDNGYIKKIWIQRFRCLFHLQNTFWVASFEKKGCLKRPWVFKYFTLVPNFALA